MSDENEHEEDLVLIQDELHDVVADVLSRHGLMATKWMMAVEVIDSAGERALESFCSPDFRAWDAIGIVGFMDARERGALGAAAAAE